MKSVIVVVVLALLAAGSVAFFYSRGNLCYYGDAEAHLNIARRIVDSRTPGYDQVGTVWLPLPHWAMLPLVRIDSLWRNGLAGAIPSAIAFVIAGSFLFAATRRIFDSLAAAFAATALWALNPNVLYLASIPMTETLASACLIALLYFTVRFRQTQGIGAVIGGGLAACAGTLTRYENWFVLPFAAVYILIAAKRRRIGATVVFCAIAGIVPLFVLFHHWLLTGDALAFYRGPYSPRTIQRGSEYPGYHNWRDAFLYYRTAAQLCAGAALPVAALAGVAVALYRRAFWPLAFLALPGAFLIWSMYSTGGTPIFLPVLKPFSYYNSRYGMAVLPLLAVAAAALVTLVPGRARAWAAGLLTLAAIVPWLFHPSPSNWITWEESRVNSEARRAWTHETAEYLKEHYVRGTGILADMGDMAGIYREAGIPLRETFNLNNGMPFQATVLRPELFLHEEWIVTQGGGDAQTAAMRAGLRDKEYRLVKQIIVKDAPVIEIYRR
jgi:hypothetical protein